MHYPHFTVIKSGNLIIQIMFGEPKTIIIKQHDSSLHRNIERDNTISTRIVENITVRKGQEFPIILESNPTTGY